MKYILSTILLLFMTVLSGCLNTQSGSSVGGVMKSADSGRTFEMRNAISEERNLGRSNVLSFAVDPANNNNLYLGTVRSDMFKSADGAASWALITTSLTNISSIVINPFNTRIIYAGGLFQGRGSVIKSVDGGENWERVYVEPKDGTNISAMAISPINGEVVHIGTTGGTIARTLNGGSSWDNLHHAQNSVNSLAIDGGDINTLYALIDGMDILKSRDNGATFESVRDMKRENTKHFYEGTLYSMAVHASTQGIIIVGTDRGVFRSDDFGLVWRPVDVIASTVGIPIHAVEVSAHDSNKVIYAAAKAVYTGVEDGWAITDTASNRSVNVIKSDPVDPSVVYIGLRSTN